MIFFHEQNIQVVHQGHRKRKFDSREAVHESFNPTFKRDGNYILHLNAFLLNKSERNLKRKFLPWNDLKNSLIKALKIILIDVNAWLFCNLKTQKRDHSNLPRILNEDPSTI